MLASYHRAILKPTWPAAALACSKAENAVTAEEIRDIDAARASYFLSETVWTRGGALTTRINDTYAADQFACRYLGAYVWNTKAKCY